MYGSWRNGRGWTVVAVVDVRVELSSCRVSEVVVRRGMELLRRKEFDD